MKVELEKYIPMIIPGFIYTFYVFGYVGDIVQFILTTIFYATILVMSANLIIGLVQLLSIKSSRFAAKLLDLRVNKRLKKLSFSDEQITDSTKELKRTMSNISKVTKEKSGEVISNLTNPESLFIKSRTLYYLMFSILASIAIDFYVFSGRRNYPSSVVIGVVIFSIVSLLSVKQILSLFWKVEIIWKDFKKNNPVK